MQSIRCGRLNHMNVVVEDSVAGTAHFLDLFGGETAGMLHVSVAQITDILMLLAVGLVCAQRLEMALRATRLLNEARSGAS